MSGRKAGGVQQPFCAQNHEDKNVKENDMAGWKEQAAALFFDGKKNINQISDELHVSRQSVSGHLKTLPGYEEEKEARKIANRARRREYKREKNRQYREEYRSRVTAETMRREHDIAVMLLSHEKY